MYVFHLRIASSSTVFFSLSLHDALPILVRDVSFRGDLAGAFDRRARVLVIDQAALETRGVTYQVAGRVELAGGVEPDRSEEHTSELQSRENLVCRLLLEKKNTFKIARTI